MRRRFAGGEAHAGPARGTVTHQDRPKNMSLKNKLPPFTAPSVETETRVAREAWRILGIMSEFVEASERLQAIKPAVSIFGSARTPVDHPYYELTEKIARLLSDSGFSVISGGGPGIMEAANK